MNKIKLKQIDREDLHHELWAKIDDDGKLVLYGYDYGTTVEKVWGDTDYEFWVFIDKELKDDVLLHLIADKFNAESDFMDWLKSKNLPFKFTNWV